MEGSGGTCPPPVDVVVATNTVACTPQCVGILAESLGTHWLPFAKQLLEPIVLTGLSDTLVQSLRKVATNGHD